MNITVILCTFNRCNSLARALESVVKSVFPEVVQWELLVVDNNSQDSTRLVVEDYGRRHLGRVHYVFESRQGKSYALNRGIREARGDLLAFMDDDVEVDRDWLNKLTAPLDNREWAGAGGRILPQAGFIPERWMDVASREGLAPLAIFDLGLAAGELKEAPFGTNMAFRKEMFVKYGEFRIDLGPQPGSEIRNNEDSEFASRLLAAGERLWYEPAAVVYHAIPQNRVRRMYFQNWWFVKARADIRELGVPSNARWCIAGIPLYLFRRLAVWTLRWMTTIQEPKRFSNKLNVFKVAGSILECYKQAHRE